MLLLAAVRFPFLIHARTNLVLALLFIFRLESSLAQNSLCGIDVMFGNGNGKEWETPYGNPMEMGIGYKIGNGNGKEWESIAREWEGVAM